MSKQLLLDQLAALAYTMKKALEVQAVLNMERWITVSPDDEDKHFCGTAACICGYQALTGRVDIFGLEDSEYKDCLSSDIADFLRGSCRKVFDRVDLADSIYREDMASRFSSANTSGLFTLDELHNLRHLNTDSPTPQDAYDYLVACIDKVHRYEY